MVTGGGRIIFAHVEQLIAFDSMEGVKKYVEARNSKVAKTYYIGTDGRPSSVFNEDEHVYVTLEGFFIKVWLAYNNSIMGV